MNTNDLKLWKIYRATNKYHDEFFNMFVKVGDEIEYLSISLLEANPSIKRFSFKRKVFDYEFWRDFSLREYNMSSLQKRLSITAAFEG